MRKSTFDVDVSVCILYVGVVRTFVVHKVVYGLEKSVFFYSGIAQARPGHAMENICASSTALTSVNISGAQRERDFLFRRRAMLTGLTAVSKRHMLFACGSIKASHLHIPYLSLRGAIVNRDKYC